MFFIQNPGNLVALYTNLVNKLISIITDTNTADEVKYPEYR